VLPFNHIFVFCRPFRLYAPPFAMVLLSARPASWRWLAITLATLWPALSVAEESKSAADYYVRGLPGLVQDSQAVKMHAG
jgi:carboxypeptidase D